VDPGRFALVAKRFTGCGASGHTRYPSADDRVSCCARPQTIGTDLMSPRRPAVPGLYSIDDGDSPALHGRRCRDCGYVFFPPHDFGCESCGAAPERVEAAALAGAGELRSFAVVHRHRGAGIEAPFTVGEIALDDGPMVRAVIAGHDELRIGDRMRTRLVVAAPTRAQAVPGASAPDAAAPWTRAARSSAPATSIGAAETDEEVELRFERAPAGERP
jgi:uncharacterized OB-fold protein